jgi:tetratricopeptide (TPR) repeat protein
MLRSLKSPLFVRLSFVGLSFAAGLVALDAPAAYGAKGPDRLDQIAVDRMPSFRETEKYQLNIAEEYYRTGKYDIAAGEYEKFITLYESSEGASYVQLKWALCQVKLKKLNTAVKDGFQTVIDYWPDSPDAVAASYLIGQTLKDMGEISQAKAAYLKTIDKHNGEMVATLARLDLAELARIEGDRARQMTLLKELVTTGVRKGDAAGRINEASRTLATMYFQDGAFPDGVTSLETTWKEPELSNQVWQYLSTPLAQLFAGPEGKDKAESKKKAETMADAAIAYFTKNQPASPKDDAEKGIFKSQGYRIAGVHSYVGRKDQAGKVYEALATKFGDDDVLVNYASWLKSDNRRDDARRVYGRMKDQLQALSYTAVSYREENRFDQAIPIYQDLITKDSKNSNDWTYQLAYTYHLAHKWKEAIATYQQCTNFPQNLWQIGECYRQQNLHKQALGIYTQIAAGYENQAAEAMWYIALCYEAEKKPESAIKTLQTICQKYSNGPYGTIASRAHQRLNDTYKITFTKGGANTEVPQ